MRLLMLALVPALVVSKFELTVKQAHQHSFALDGNQTVRAIR